MTRTTHKPAILGAAVSLAREKPYYQLTRRDVACAAECSSALVSHHFGSMEGLYDAVVDYAIQHAVWRVIGDAMLQRHPLTASLASGSRAKAILELTR